MTDEPNATTIRVAKAIKRATYEKYGVASNDVDAMVEANWESSIPLAEAAIAAYRKVKREERGALSTLGWTKVPPARRVEIAKKAAKARWGT